MDEELHDYESIDEYLPREMCNKGGGTLPRKYSEERSHYDHSRPMTLPKSISLDPSMEDRYSSDSLQFKCSIPKDQMYQSKVPLTVGCASEPATPVSTATPHKTGNNISLNLRSPKTLHDLQSPPRIDRSTKPPARPPKPAKVIIERKEPHVISKSYSLSDFCAYEPMPKMIRVSAGHYGETEKTSISEGEEFVFYLLKTVLAIPAKPMGSLSTNEKFHIPINSMLKIAVMDKHSDSIRKYVYSSPKDLMANRKDCPQIVCVTKDHFIKSVLLPAGTLLFLSEKPIKRSGRHFIHCKSRKDTEYDLPMDSACNLTTHPGDTQIHIREYLEMVNKFPVDVQLFHGDSDEIYEEPSEVTSSIGMTLTLDKPVKQKSIIAKTDLEGTRKDNPITVEIPFDLPIEVEAIERPEENMEQIYSEVLDLYQNFNPENIERSYAMYESSFQKQLGKTVSLLNHEYEKADIDYQLECPNTDYEPLQEVLNQREQFLHNQIASGKSTADDVGKLKEENKKLQEEIERLKKQKHGDYTKLIKSSDADNFDFYTPLEHLDNMQELKNLDETGISKLLENMGLPQYIEKFKEQGVDGNLLAVLSEDDLSGLVQLSLHKKRLMLIATGQISIRKYFDEENPYGTTTTVHK